VSLIRFTVLAILAAFSLSGAALPQTGPYLSDFPKLYPAGYTKWSQSLPYGLGTLPEWLTAFKGVVSPLRDVSVGGAPMKFGTTCKPHDCGGNIAGILYSPQRNRIVGLVRLSAKDFTSSSLLLVGPASSAEFICIQRLLSDHQSIVC